MLKKSLGSCCWPCVALPSWIRGQPLMLGLAPPWAGQPGEKQEVLGAERSWNPRSHLSVCPQMLSECFVTFAFLISCKFLLWPAPTRRGNRTHNSGTHSSQFKQVDTTHSNLGSDGLVGVHKASPQWQEQFPISLNTLPH